MVIILYHATDRNRQLQLLKDSQRDIYLPTSAIHHDHVRKFCKAARFLFFCGSLKFFSFFYAMGKASCQHLTHAGVVVRS